MTRRRGFSKLILETDCQEALKIWERRMRDRSVIANIFTEVYELSSHLESFVFRFVPREVNVPVLLALMCVERSG